MSDLKEGEEVTENYIANVRYQYRVSYFLYKRKKSRWMSTYEKINSLIQLPVTYEDSYLNKNLDGSKNEDLPHLEDMALKPLANDKKKITTYRILSMLSLVFCLFFLATEATVIWDPKYTLMYIVSKLWIFLSSFLVL